MGKAARAKKEGGRDPFKGRTFVVDFDDLCDNVVETLGTVEKCKEKWPDFQCTLFAIPARLSVGNIAVAKELDEKYGGGWLALAPHGYFHTRGECLGWTKQEAIDKIMMAKEMGIDAPIFRAPAWLLDVDVYRACEELGYVVASHGEFRIPVRNRGDLGPVREYVYNDVRLRKKGTRAIHGHLTNVSGNWIEDT